MENNLLVLIKNGVHITILHALFILFNFYPFLTTTICLKLYTTNYFYWFGHNYAYFKNKKFNFIKQFVKFTDFGHTASLIYFFYHPFLPIAHNIHFIITLVYWIAIFRGVQDTSDIDHPHIIQWYINFWSAQSHIVPYLMILKEIKNSESVVVFDNHSLILSYLWMYFWGIFIYSPWRLLTKDSVYSNLKESVPYFGIIVTHLFCVLANYVGNYCNQIK